MSAPPFEKPPRVAWGLYRRFALAGALIVPLTAAAVATAGLHEVDSTVDIIKDNQRQVHFTKPDVITEADAGQPQTILLVGSDKRYGAAKNDARSDTMMLVRLDPDQQATTVMSIPRDLLTEIPGHGTSKINAAYGEGGLELVTRTVKQLLSRPGEPFKINHAIGVNFKGFRGVVNFVGCIYIDVDRRYYHRNGAGGEQYAEIDVTPGYQPLCGQRALDYVRFRHADNTFVRDARQQGFLREAKDQISSGKLIGQREDLIRALSKATEADDRLATRKSVLRLFKLAAFSASHPIRQVPFTATDVESAPAPTGLTSGAQTAAVGGFGSYVTASPETIAETVDSFMHGGGTTTAAAKKPTATKPRNAQSKKASAKGTEPADFGLVDARRTGEDLVAAASASPRLKGLPLYFPRWLTPRGRYPVNQPPNAPMPYVYTLRDRAGKRHRAYRLVVTEDEQQGSYYGIQGTTWKSPPVLTRSSTRVRMAGRTYRVFYNGGRIRLVAWKTPRAVYWVSNTLRSELSSRAMLGIARSLTNRLG